VTNSIRFFVDQHDKAISFSSSVRLQPELLDNKKSKNGSASEIMRFQNYITFRFSSCKGLKYAFCITLNLVRNFIIDYLI
jgi:hypothetical protein